MSRLTDCVAFLQKLIRIPSLPGQEDEVAQAVADEMTRLGYQEVKRDEAGNIIGLIRGRGAAPAVMLNTHLDQVDVGDESRWPYPPFGGQIHQQRIWGRGAMDIKGPLAAQVYAAADLLQADSPPPGDVWVTAVVQEEVGGLGARHLSTHLKPQLVVVGEASHNQLRRGHRGRTELLLWVKGRSVHASVPHRGVNPLEVVCRFIGGLGQVEKGYHPDLGHSSVAPTLIRTDQTSANVIPAEAWLTCDWRNVPGESGEQVRTRLAQLARDSLIAGAEAEVIIPTVHRVSYTGFQDDIPADNPAYILEESDPAVRAAEEVLGQAIGVAEPAGVWQFATDGGHFSLAGQTVVGYGPGEEHLAHTVDESIAVQEIETALIGNLALARDWPHRFTKLTA